MEKNYLQASKFVLYPSSPHQFAATSDLPTHQGKQEYKFDALPAEQKANIMLDFGTVEQGEKVTPKTFTIDSVAESDGTITCDADWMVVSPDAFTKGQNLVSVQLATERLRKDEEYRAQLVVSLDEEKEILEVRVFVRRYNDEDIAAMETRLTVLEQQLATVRRVNQQLQDQLNQLKQSKTPIIIDQLEKQIHATLEHVSDLKTYEETANNILPAAKYLEADKTAKRTDETPSRRIISVAQDGSGDFKNLCNALKSTRGGEEILVKAGTYHEDNIHLKNGITLNGEGADKTVIISEGQAFLISKVSDVKISGFRIQGKFTGFYITESQNVTIEENVLINCGTYGIANYGDCQNLSVRNNTITDNLVGIRMSGNSGFIIKNNIIINNSKGIDGYNSTCWEIAYNNFYNNDVNCIGCSRSETDISIDPMFVAPEEEDFRLKPSSPCINAGKDGMTIGAVIG